MFYMIYSSYSTGFLNDEDLKALLDHSRRRNIFRAITGVLFYYDGKFIQLIEGEEDAVRRLYIHIYKDSRHRDVTAHKEGFNEERLFPDWTMAFKPILPGDVKGIRGFRDMSVGDEANVASVTKLYNMISS